MSGDGPTAVRARRRLQIAPARARLAGAGIKWRELSQGGRMVISHGGGSIDFFPGTGVWRVRGLNGGSTRQGIDALIQFATQGKLV